VLAVAAGLLHRAWRPTPRRPQPALAPLGIMPAVLIMAVAAAYLVYLGKPYVAPMQREAPAP